MDKKSQAYEYLKHAIIVDEIPPGSPLVELELSESLQMSRTPIREAMRQLETEGLVTTYPARGSFVTVLTPDDVQEIYELRLALELWALERSIARITDEELDALQAAFEEGYRTGAWETLHNADRGLHDLITEKAWSRRLLMLLSLLNTQAERIRYQSARSLGRDDLSYREHLHIIQCIRERDLEKSRAALRTHLRSVANSAMDAAKAQAVKSSL
ncbi:GntR family transcriptional regulator [Dysosmobacter sp. HCP28S3_G4]|uniref:GntR family transcriptional regulator n=1 Tax=Dysosmobacter sp. HCP28S3_G4 TaxID=3438938 RepID=UPI003F8CA2B5|nr:GntR family transcriptional regulator [Dysosmobacter sp.]